MAGRLVEEQGRLARFSIALHPGRSLARRRVVIASRRPVFPDGPARYGRDMSEPAGVTTFFWHDYETFGSQPRRDRPAQFAGVRTDMELRELDAPATWFCRPPRDLLPDPEAVLLTGITPQRAVAAGLPEPVFAARIQAELGRRGTIGAGYNSIRFDDEVTRHLFWRNLMDPYAREYADGCSRWDLLDVMRCTWALRPEGIAWPTGEDGRPSFRLGLLAAANGLAHDAAHDALSDVRATIALARLARARQPKLWGFALDLRHKENVRRQIGAGRPFLHVSGRYPVERGCMAVAWPLAPHPVNRNEVIVWDLAEDPGILARLDAPALRRRVFGGAAELADGEARLPIKTIHVNRAPIVVGNLGVLGPDGGRFAIDRAQAERHAAQAARLPDLSALWAEAFARPPAATPTDPEEDLYGGFVGDADRRRLEALRTQPPERLARPIAFDDPRLDELLFRFRARNFPDTLDAAEHARWARHVHARLHEGAGGVKTLAQFHAQVDALAGAAAERDDHRALELLEALVDWAETIA
jgi:exodeoxyribonuclease-1